MEENSEADLILSKLENKNIVLSIRQNSKRHFLQDLLISRLKASHGKYFYTFPNHIKCSEDHLKWAAKIYPLKFPTEPFHSAVGHSVNQIHDVLLDWLEQKNSVRILLPVSDKFFRHEPVRFYHFIYDYLMQADILQHKGYDNFRFLILLNKLPSNFEEELTKIIRHERWRPLILEL